jgi:hypothetical protein
MGAAPAAAGDRRPQRSPGRGPVAAGAEATAVLWSSRRSARRRRGRDRQAGRSCRLAAVSSARRRPVVVLVPDRTAPAPTPCSWPRPAQFRSASARAAGGACGGREAAGAIVPGAGRAAQLRRGHARRPARGRPARSRSRGGPMRRPSDRSERPNPEQPSRPNGRLSVIALDGIPEIRPGDDLEALLIEALRATPGRCRSPRTTFWSSLRRSCPRPRARSSI